MGVSEFGFSCRELFILSVVVLFVGVPNLHECNFLYVLFSCPCVLEISYALGINAPCVLASSKKGGRVEIIC